MEIKKDTVLYSLNKAIIEFRGIYSLWSKRHGINYNEMLVLYTIREYGYCTQKQICDSYLLPRQTINNVILNMKKRGLLEIRDKIKKEKVFILTDTGKEFAKVFIQSLQELEYSAIQEFGVDNIKQITELLNQYDEALVRHLSMG